jgi:hypothetical protein
MSKAEFVEFNETMSLKLDIFVKNKTISHEFFSR